jgi:hypothetical protein
MPVIRVSKNNQVLRKNMCIKTVVNVKTDPLRRKYGPLKSAQMFVNMGDEEMLE